MTEPDVSSFCTLDPKALRERIAMVRREILPHATRTEALSDGRAWTFPATLRNRLQQLVELERQCCTDEVRFSLREIEGELRLEVHGVDPNAEVFRALESTAPVPHLAPGLKSAGLGLGISAVLFCALPLLAVALFGAAATPLAALDHPAYIAAGAVAFGLAIWLRKQRRPEPPDTSS